MADPVGQDNWLAYLEEAVRNASDLEQRVHIVELFKTAVAAEPGSLRLWMAYCEYFQKLWECSFSPDDGWSEEEQLMGQELFPLEASLDLWKQGYEAIQYRLGDSHELWDRWISFEIEQFKKSRTSDQLRRITQLYEHRLSTPHITWDHTSQSFSGFLSEYNQTAWESTMKEVTAAVQVTKRAISVRDPFELKLKQAERSNDVETQKSLLRNYLDWEVRGTKRKHQDAELSVKLCSGLFDRALTGLFSTDEDTWLDYIVFLSSTIVDQSSLSELLGACGRAVQHCPWAGKLWGRYILSAEEAHLSFSDIESIKQTANTDNQLCRDGMEGLIEMYSSWCAYLKRTASTTVEEATVADELHAAIEDVNATGRKLYGKEFEGDPKYRLERIYIEYLTEDRGATDEARALWKTLVKSRYHADNFDFWLSYYTWEMLVFLLLRDKDGRSDTPTQATAVLHSAAKRKSVDWPERVLELYLQHCNTYETPEVARQANDFVCQTQKLVTHRREKEQAAQAAQYAAYYEAQAQAQGETRAENQAETQAETQAEVQQQSLERPDVDLTPPPGGGPKRKRDALADAQAEGREDFSKRQRNGHDTTVDTSAPGQPPQRDREHSTVIVTNLPLGATQTEVRKYFKPYGHINNITAFVREEQKQSTTALIEFSSAEEAQSALLRHAKYFGESQISVQPGHDLTVYVANYPPAADEKFITDLFKDCGEILSIRWPSLKVNTHRRFCYISFRDRDASAKAVAKEGTLVEGKYRLLAKYSDPSRKKRREGAIAEGREVHVSNLDQSTTEDQLREVFGKFGTVTRVNIPQSMAGHNRGFAFLDFETKEQAARAAQELNNTKFRSRILKVDVSKENKVKPAAKSTDFQRSSASPAFSPSAQDDEGDEAMGDTSSDRHHDKPSSSEIAARTIALMGLPDTVNDARVKALVEPLGPFVKLIHQPGHGGAIIEFADAATAGKAALRLNSMEYEGRQLRTGSPDQLRHNRPEAADDGANGPRTRQAGSKPKGALLPPALRRPVLGRAAPKRGGPGLAPRKGGPASAAGASAKRTEDGGGSAGSSGPKSNAEFKALFLAGRE